MKRIIWKTVIAFVVSGSIVFVLLWLKCCLRRAWSSNLLKHKWVADHALTILVSPCLSHQLYFTFKLCICLEYLMSPLTTVNTQMQVFLMGQFKFNFPGITPSQYFKFFYCFKLILFHFFFIVAALLLFCLCVDYCHYFYSSFWMIPQKEAAAFTTAFFHAVRPLPS